jgi:hypothetical protein
MAIEIRGVDQLADISRKLKQAGDRDLQREFRRGLDEAVEPIKDTIRESARDILPRQGGLNERVARTPIRVVTRNTARATGIRLTVRGTRRAALDQGRLRHPVFGDREVWVTQRVTPGWWSNAIDDDFPEARRAVQAAMDRVARKLR